MKKDATPGGRAVDGRKLDVRAVSTFETEDTAGRPAENVDDIALPDQPFAEGAQDAIDPDLRHRLISETAYSHYIERGYADGYDVDDWLQAEAEVDHLLLNPQPGETARSTR